MAEGRLPIFIGPGSQRGYGLGGMLSGLFRTAMPFVKRGASKLAKELGISRAGLIMKVEKYDLDKRRLRKS